MRKLCMNKSDKPRKSVFIFLFYIAFCCSSSIPANAQYYLAENKPQTSGNEYQNVEYCEYLGVTSSTDGSANGSSEECANGFLTFFLSIVGACVGLPMITMCLLRAIVARGMASGYPHHRGNDFYLDAPSPPLRWYDPSRKNLFENLGR